VTVLVLRYWHIRHLEAPGPLLDGKLWEQGFKHAGLESRCQEVAEFVASNPTVVRPREEISELISTVLLEARQVRLWTTTACITRQMGPGTSLNPVTGRHAARLWPSMPFKRATQGWLAEKGMLGGLLGYWVRIRTLQSWSTVPSMLHQWRLSMIWRSKRVLTIPESPVVFSCACTPALAQLWGEKVEVLKRYGVGNLQYALDAKPASAVPLYILFRMGGVNWKHNAAWYQHHGTAGWAETMLYLRVQQEVRPPDMMIERQLAGPEEQVRAVDWAAWRTAVQASLVVLLPA
jgi:hypothetical protein